MSVGQQPKDVNAYHREYMHRRRASARDIGSIPAVVDPERRRAGSESLAEFCKVYFPDQFTLPWSPYHFRAAEKIERAVREGGFFAFAMPRASGKTTICRWSVLWATLNGHLDYVVLVGASERASEKQLRNIRTMLCRNPLLAEDYPEAVVPIRQIMLDSVLPTKQTCRGERTFIDWQVNRLVLPWIPLDLELSTASRGAVIEVMGITAEIRGLNHVTPDNCTIRPRLALCDDPQTRESAKSPDQSHTRLETMNGDLAYLAGPDKPIAIVCPCTVIYEGDLADTILNREEHSEWQGERVKMVESFPTNVKLWDDYADIIRNSQRAGTGKQLATEFYEKHREAMDAGAVVSWPERFRADELSAIQHAMNLKIRDEASFFAECQNEPIQEQNSVEMLSLDEICAKTTGHSRGVVPDSCSILTAFTDVQADHLFWMVCGWDPDFTGYVIDYGAWPDQHRTYFKRREVRKKLSQRYTGDDSGIMYAALTDLGSVLFDRRYPKQNGGELSINRWCIDAGWKPIPIKAFAVQSKHRSAITLTYGKYIGAKSLFRWDESPRAKKWKTIQGNWQWSNGPGPAKSASFDTNWWKRRIHMALARPTNSAGSIQLFQASAQTHRMLAEHLLAEKCERVTANGRTVDEFEQLPNRDNEGLDCLVGCAVAASICGIVPKSEQSRPKSPPPPTLAELAAQLVK